MLFQPAQAGMEAQAASSIEKTETELTRLSIGAAAELLKSGKLSPVDLTQACLTRIEQLNPVLNAFITVTAETALAEARRAEHEIRQGRWRGPLHGVPIGLKDLIDTAGVRTTCGSALYANRVPAEDAEVVRRLQVAGAVLLGKQNMQEFAYGGTSAASHYGAVRNPWAVTCIPGGSSGGSAAAVAAGLCYAAIGSDTGGSIREPAAYCGIVGLMPTYGRVSTRGAIPLSWSFDHLGPLCRNVTDAALVLDAIAGYDPLDPASIDRPVASYSSGLQANVAAPRIGVVRRPFFEDLDAEIEQSIRRALDVIAPMSASISDVDLPGVPSSVVPAEAYTFHRQYLADAPELYMPWTRQRLQHGASISTVAYVEGRRELERIRRAVQSVFANVDLLVTPTTPVQAITIEQAVNMMEPPPPPGELWLRNTRPFNGLGLPAISIPCGFTRAGLPIGLQIAGPPFGEERVLAFAHAYESATDWHGRAPAL
jgi:aspartyl-tRNA(Asn)/glutamyl-tRNA(Gln) amidotransferase subunit A